VAAVKARTQRRDADQGFCATAISPSPDAKGTRDSVETVPEADSLLKLVLNRDNVLEAWKRVKANGGAPGVDGRSIDDSSDFIRSHWLSIRRRIEEGHYRPSPVRRTEIPKGNGETRPLGIPTVLDRMIQQALAQVLVPIFDPGFSDHSYGFRPGRSASHAVHWIEKHIREGKSWAIDIDLSKFFDRVDHDLLMERVGRKVKDKQVLKLIGRFLRAGVEVDGAVHPTQLGVPQGGPLSPLLANIMLDDLDKKMELRGHTFSRYADDFVILVSSQKAANRVMGRLRSYITTRLKLVVNETKSKVVPSTQAKFLGFTFTRKKIRWTEKSFLDFRHRIRELTKRNWGVSIEYRISKINEYIRGWMGYFQISQFYSPVEHIDEWIRRRLRACFLIQWRKARTRVRNLIRLGVKKGDAIKTGSSGKSYWRLSKTIATNCGLSIAAFQDYGLISVRDMWINFHYSKG